MKKDNKIARRLRPFTQALPDIFNYQIITKIAIAVWLFLLGLVSLFIYVAFDLNSKVVLCRNLFLGQKSTLKATLDEAFISIRKLISLRGLLVVLYIALVAPILGFGLSITATKSLYIPTFITSFIQSSVLLSALAGAAVILLLVIGIANLFILHGVVIDGLSVKEASKQSRRLIHANWKDYIKQNALFILLMLGSVAGIAVLCLFLPLKLISLLPAGPVSRALTVFFCHRRRCGLHSYGALRGTALSLEDDPAVLLLQTRLRSRLQRDQARQAGSLQDDYRI